MTLDQWSPRVRRGALAVAIAAALIVLGPFIIGYAASSGPPSIPHPVADHTDCLSCHASGVAGAPVVPADHQGRDNTTCTACHQMAQTSPAQAAPTPQPPAAPAAPPAPTQAPAVTQTPAATSAPAAAPAMLGNFTVADWTGQTCKACHPKEYTDWSESGHAMTLSAQLLNKDHDSSEQLDQTCVKCHSPELGTVKIGNIVGPLDMKGPWKLVGQYASLGNTPSIPCLACHQPHTVKPAGLLPGEDFGDESTFYRGVPAPQVTNLKIYDAFAQKYIDPPTIAPVMNGGQAVPIDQSLSNRLCSTCHGTDMAESNLFQPNVPATGDNSLGSGDNRTPTGAHQGIACVTCHMVGGSHTFNPMNSCSQCHGKDTSLPSLDYVTNQVKTSFNDPSLSMLTGNASPLNIHWLDESQVWPPAEVTMTAADAGDTVTYTITIRNHATWDLSNVTVKGTVPAGAKYLDSWVGSSANPGTFDGSAASLKIDSIGGGKTSDTITYRVSKGSAKDFTAHAWISWDKEIPGTAVSANVTIPK